MGGEKKKMKKMKKKTTKKKENKKKKNKNKKKKNKNKNKNKNKKREDGMEDNCLNHLSFDRKISPTPTLFFLQPLYYLHRLLERRKKRKFSNI